MRRQHNPVTAPDTLHSGTGGLDDTDVRYFTALGHSLRNQGTSVVKLC
jgi:hypothetical protein